MKRRRFLAGATSSAAALCLPYRGLASSEPLSGFIYGVSTLNPVNIREELSSIVRLDIASGNITYHPLPDHRFGHSLLSLPDGGFFAVPYGDDTTECLFLDSELNTVETFAAPDGYGFGGHAALLPDGERIFGHFNHAGYTEGKRATDQTGQNYVLNIETREVEQTDETDIILGHDIILSRDGKRLFVGDDSTLEQRSAEEMMEAEDSPYHLINHAPAVVVFNAETFKEEKTVPLNINGSLVHIEQGKDGSVFGAAEQYISPSPEGMAALRKLLGVGGDIEKYVDYLTEENPDTELPYPGPLVKVDIESGETVEHLAPQNQGPFDIKLNEETGAIFNIFTDSNMIARYNSSKQSWGYFPSASYGIDQPYGLTDIPGTTYMALNGFMQGITIFDAQTMSEIARFDTQNFGIKHLSYRR